MDKTSEDYDLCLLKKGYIKGIKIKNNKILINIIPYYQFNINEIMDYNEIPYQHYICNLYNNIDLIIKKNVIEEHFNHITHKYKQIYNKEKYRSLIRYYFNYRDFIRATKIVQIHKHLNKLLGKDLMINIMRYISNHNVDLLNNKITSELS